MVTLPINTSRRDAYVRSHVKLTVPPSTPYHVYPNLAESPCDRSDNSIGSLLELQSCETANRWFSSVQRDSSHSPLAGSRRWRQFCRRRGAPFRRCICTSFSAGSSFVQQKAIYYSQRHSIHVCIHGCLPQFITCFDHSSGIECPGDPHPPPQAPPPLSKYQLSSLHNLSPSLLHR